MTQTGYLVYKQGAISGFNRGVITPIKVYFSEEKADEKVREMNDSRDHNFWETHMKEVEIADKS